MTRPASVALALASLVGPAGFECTVERRGGELIARIHAGRGSDIDVYGATSPPEFFAVVTEMFFEKPAQLRARHPELYETLKDFYRQDPAALGTRGP